MDFLGAILLLACLVGGALFYWQRLFLHDNVPESRRWFKHWAIRGLGLPVLLWIIFNLGGSPVLPPLVTQVILGQVGGGWLGRMVALTVPALVIISSYWAGLTCIWLVVAFASHRNQRREFIITSLFWCAVMSPLAWLTVHAGGWEAVGFAAILCFGPIVHYAYAAAGTETFVPPPLYTRAIVNLKFGKYNEAEAEVIQELEKHEEDFDGWMMLADLYANNFHDLAEADRTVRGLITQPNITPTQISIAFHRLADWHLKLRDDPVAARHALEQISRQIPGTHLDHMARLRINQLPATAKELLEQRKGRTLRMPPLNDSLDSPPAPEPVAVDRTAAAAQANQCVEQLKQDPNDVAAREKLAHILAEQLGKAAAAVEQVGLLMDMPDQPEPKMAEWLALIAAWQFSYCQDWDAARKSLERLVRDYPQSPHAFAAQRRLSLMAMELKIQKLRAGSTPVARAAVDDLAGVPQKPSL
jgi:hypothetical protein